MTPLILTRAQWGARPPKSTKPIALPSRELWLHHTGGNERGPQGMRSIQNFHMDVRGWSDIAYSYVIDPDTGTVYEGRGAGFAGAHTEGHNSISHAICVMGNYDTTPIPAGLTDTIAALVVAGHRQGWWPDHITGGHRDASGADTVCPGRYLEIAIRHINTVARAVLANDPPPKETTMPTPDQWGPHHLAVAVATVRDIYALHRPYAEAEIDAWRRDLWAKLTRGEDPTATYRWIDDTLKAGG